MKFHVPIKPDQTFHGLVQEREEARLRRFRESQFMDTMRDSARPPHRRGSKQDDYSQDL